MPAAPMHRFRRTGLVAMLILAAAGCGPRDEAAGSNAGETGAAGKGKGARIGGGVLEKERKKDFNLTRTERFAQRTRHFTDSGIIGTKEFVSATYGKFRHFFQTKKEKKPHRIRGLDGIWSMKRFGGC